MPSLATVDRKQLMPFLLTSLGVSLVLSYHFARADSNMDFVNAEIAVVVDRSFASAATDRLLQSMRVYLRALRRSMRVGGLRADFLDSVDGNVRKDATATLSVASCNDTWRLSEKLRDRAVVHLAITEGACARLPGVAGVTVPLGARHRRLPQLLLDLRSSGQMPWTASVLLHDASVDGAMVDGVVRALTAELPRKGGAGGGAGASVAVFRLQPRGADWDRRGQVLRVLRHLPSDRSGSNYVAMVSGSIAGLVLDVASSLGLTHPRHQWLFVLTDGNRGWRHSAAALAPLLGDGLNAAFVANASARTATQRCADGAACHARELLRALALAVEARVKDEAQQAQQVSEEEWEALRPSRRVRAQALLRDVQEWLAARGRCGRCERWNVSAAETWGSAVAGGPAARLAPVAQWTPARGPRFGDRLFPHAAHGFRGREMPIVTFHNPPWQIITYNATNKSLIFRGVVFEALKVLAKNLNFSYSLYLPASNGQSLNNESTTPTKTSPTDEIEDISKIIIPWDSIVNLVRKQKVFLGAGAFTVTQKRMALVNFTLPLGSQGYTFLASRPRELSRAALFMYPFTMDTWLCLALSVFATGFALYAIHIHSPYYAFHGIHTEAGLMRINNCMWYMYGALLQQGGLYLPRADSGRLVVGAWWLLVIVVVSTYSGNLIAFLTFPRFEAPINSVRDLLTRPGVTWGTLGGGPLLPALKESDDASLQRLVRGAERHEAQDEALAQRVRTGAHVFLERRHNLVHLAKRLSAASAHCHFFIAPEDFLQEEVSMIISKNSPYLDMIDQELRAMHQAGLLNKWLADALPRKDRCDAASSSGDAANHKVNMNDMQGSFFMLFLGTALSVVIIIGECCVRRHLSFRERRLIRPFVT